MMNTESVNRATRFIIDHGTIHDLVTGRHVRTDPEDGYEDGIEKCCALLNALALSRDTLAAEKAHDYPMWDRAMRETLGAAENEATVDAASRIAKERDEHADRARAMSAELTELCVDRQVDRAALGLLRDVAKAARCVFGDCAESDWATLREALRKAGM
jgi:hypothetical protein